MTRSQQLSKLRGVKKALLWPYVGLIVAVRLVSVGRGPLLSLLPSRIIREVPEIPFAIYCAMLFLSVVLNRCGGHGCMGTLHLHIIPCRDVRRSVSSPG